MNKPLLTTVGLFPKPYQEPTSKGKVRDVYDLGNERLLIIATDRISAYDVISSEGIPEKGKVLTEMSAFCFGLCYGITPNHVVFQDLRTLPIEFQDHLELLEGRSLIVRKSEPVMIEMVVRGYLAGPAWKDYLQNQSVAGIWLKKGYQECDKLDDPIVTPAIKAVSGHDETINPYKAEEIIGRGVYRQLDATSQHIYFKISEFAESRGIIIADTKFEFGWHNGRLIWIDEAMTPDSSRFWEMTDYRPGIHMEGLDKQPLRDWLDSIGWDHKPPMPTLPPEIIEATSKRYLKARDLLLRTS